MRNVLWTLSLMLTLCLLGQAAHAVQVIHLKEYLGHTFTDELISYPLDAGLRQAASLQVIDDTGASLPCQVVYGRIYLLVSLKADSERTFTVRPGQPAAAERQVRVSEDGDLLTFDSGVMAVRLTNGKQDYATPLEGTQAPGPLRGVRTADGAWIGKSWLQAPLKVTGYQTTVTARGPLFAEALVEYTFEGGKHYRFSLRAIAGQPTAIIDELMDLNPGGKYKMLTYKNDMERSVWDWWTLDGTDHLVKGDHTPHEANVVFSFYDGLQPDQCRWRGSQASEPRKGVDAGGKTWTAWDNFSTEAYAPLTYDRDEEFNRVAGWRVNSFPDCAMLFTIFNEKDPHSAAITFSQGVPSRNLNPTYATSPQPWIKMYTGLNDLRIWTRKDKDLQVIAPIVLGTRNWLLTVEPQAALPPKGAKPISTGYLAIPKYSRYPLEKLKDWTFDWPEVKNAYPRMFCKPGDLRGMQARVAASGDAKSSMYLASIYQAGGTPEKTVKQVMAFLKPQVDDSFSACGLGNINWFHISLNTIMSMPLWDAAMGTPGITRRPARRSKPTAPSSSSAPGTRTTGRPRKERMAGGPSIWVRWRAPGACSPRSCGAGMPHDAAWVKRSKDYMLGNLLPLVGEDGSGVSCPSYLGASIEQVLYMALALKYGGGYDAFKEEPRLRKYAQFMMDILTPPDPRPRQNDPTKKNLVSYWEVGDTSRQEFNRYAQCALPRLCRSG